MDAYGVILRSILFFFMLNVKKTIQNVREVMLNDMKKFR